MTVWEALFEPDKGVGARRGLLNPVVKAPGQV